MFPPLLLAIVLAIAAVACLLTWIRHLKRVRAIEDLPTSRIRSAAQGQVEIEGTAQPIGDDRIVAPLSKSDCVWWRYRIQILETTHGKRGNWRVIEEQCSDEIFEIDDGTGRCIVDPEGATVIPSAVRSWSGSRPFPDYVPAHVRAPKRFGIVSRAGMLDRLSAGSARRYRYREEILSAHAPIYGIGHFRSQSAVADRDDENAEVRLLLAEWKRDQSQLMRFDENEDGQIDLTEWEQVREAAMREVRRRQAERAAQPMIHVLCRSPDRRKFLLSAIPQRDLIRRDRRFATAAFAGFVASVAGLAWVAGVHRLF